MARFVMSLVVFAIVLLALNYFFHWHIAVGASLVLTVVLSLVFGMFQSGRR
ncbi:MAG: hypothetical protein GY888_17155 [Planctomycetaceae bacterium]|nr:hypothetical protein [Planctomycetaceae bacterium]